MRYRVRFVVLAFASFVLSFLGSFLTSGAFPHRLLATALCSLLSFQSNACLAQLPRESERAVAAVSTAHTEKSGNNNDEQKVAGCPFGICVGVPKIPVPNIPGSGEVQNQINQAVYQQIGDALGAKAAIHLDAKSQLFKKVPDLTDFHPTHLTFTSLEDLEKPLPPGDYSLDVMSFCTQWSIHVPGHNSPYSVGQADGSRIGVITAFLIRGQIAGLSPDQLHNMSWKIQAGAPLSSWNESDRALVHRIIPEFEGQLQSDLYDQIKGEYERVRHTVPAGLPDFDGFVSHVPLGRQYQSLRQAQKILTNRSIASQEVGKSLYDATAEQDGQPYILPAYSGNHKSSWGELEPGVYGRYTVLHARAGAGSDGINLLELRITKEAGKSASAEGVKVAMAGSDAGVTRVAQLPQAIAIGGLIYRGYRWYRTAQAARRLGQAIAAGEVRPVIAYPEQKTQALVSIAKIQGNGGGNNQQQKPDENSQVKFPPSNKLPSKVAPPDKVKQALADYKPIEIPVDSKPYLVDKDDMTHILQRHHPEYWDGSVKSNQTFFDAKMSVNDIEQVIRSIINSNENAVIRIGSGIGQLPATIVDGVKYVLGLNKGHVGQLYPIVP